MKLALIRRHVTINRPKPPGRAAATSRMSESSLVGWMTFGQALAPAILPQCTLVVAVHPAILSSLCDAEVLVSDMKDSFLWSILSPLAILFPINATVRRHVAWFLISGVLRFLPILRQRWTKGTMTPAAHRIATARMTLLRFRNRAAMSVVAHRFAPHEQAFKVQSTWQHQRRSVVAHLSARASDLPCPSRERSRCLLSLCISVA